MRRFRTYHFDYILNTLAVLRMNVDFVTDTRLEDHPVVSRFFKLLLANCEANHLGRVIIHR